MGPFEKHITFNNFLIKKKNRQNIRFFYAWEKNAVKYLEEITSPPGNICDVIRLLNS